MPVPYDSFVRCLSVKIFLNAASMSDDLELCQLWIIFYVHGYFVLVKTLVQRNYAVSACQLQKPSPDNIQSTVLVVCIPALCVSMYDCYLLAGVYQGVLCVEKTQCQAPWRIMQN